MGEVVGESGESGEVGEVGEVGESGDAQRSSMGDKVTLVDMESPSLVTLVKLARSSNRRSSSLCDLSSCSNFCRLRFCKFLNAAVLLLPVPTLRLYFVTFARRLLTSLSCMRSACSAACSCACHAVAARCKSSILCRGGMLESVAQALNCSRFIVSAGTEGEGCHV